ncbi:bifunctional oligoribonuclease/PAP phosphatase NrnA [Candidatus Peribacteria bacterium]|nr:bifunctional oligoribonuclease/PAP phosphatase NrnA [Candidatus Peribacteria bacterium]
MRHHTFVTAEQVEAFRAAIEPKPRTLVITHSSPDGDAFGSSFGLAESLRAAGLTVTTACVDPLPTRWQWSPRAEQYVQDFTPSDYELVIWTDCADYERTGFHHRYPQLAQLQSVNIDHHHKSNDHWATLNIVPENASSAAIIVAELLQLSALPVPPQAATALLLGMYTDTGDFQYAATPEIFAMASWLVEKGARLRQINDKSLQRYSFAQLKFWGKILENLTLTDENVAIAGVYTADYQSVGAEREDIGVLKNWLGSIQDADYSVLLSEDEAGNVKASLRTRRDDLDLQALAKDYGGGGHVKASGFSIPHSRLKREVQWKIIPQDPTDN